MRFLGNICWFLFGGFISGMSWLIVGLGWCLSIVGIPVGVQCFKLAGLAFWPFGKNVSYEGGAVSFLLNVVWFLFGGFILFIENMCLGLLFCITVVGMPFGLQLFKIAKLGLAPFGAVVDK